MWWGNFSRWNSWKYDNVRYITCKSLYRKTQKIKIKSTKENQKSCKKSTKENQKKLQENYQRKQKSCERITKEKVLKFFTKDKNTKEKIKIKHKR